MYSIKDEWSIKLPMAWLWKVNLHIEHSQDETVEE